MGRVCQLEVVLIFDVVECNRFEPRLKFDDVDWVDWDVGWDVDCTCGDNCDDGEEALMMSTDRE